MTLLRNNRLLWTIQVLVALVFLFAGAAKLAMPNEALEAQPPYLPGLFLKFIATMEVLGALGLVLPGLTGIKRQLIPLAASGLVVIMIGATVITVATVGVLPALLPFCVGLLAILIAIGRREYRTTRIVSV